MFGFGKKNKNRATVDHTKRSVQNHTESTNKRASARPVQKPMPRSILQNPQPPKMPSPIKKPKQETLTQPTHEQKLPKNTSSLPNRMPLPSKGIQATKPNRSGIQNSIDKKPKEANKINSDLPTSSKSSKNKKVNRGPLITAKGVKSALVVIIIAVILAFLILSLMNGILYAVNHFSFDFGYDVTVRLENGAQKIQKYECDSDNVFREIDKEPYISITKLADSLSLSAIGNGEKVKFYRIDELDNYVSMEHGSRHVIINGESICLTSAVYISGSQVYVPISFFERYTSSIVVNYDKKSHTMSVIYEINEELSTPKRKVLKEFRFVVSEPQGLTEMTEEERNEYATLSKK